METLLTTADNSAGIGYTPVEQMVLHGAKVYMASRNEVRAIAATRKIRDEHPTIIEDTIVWLSLGLVDPHSIARAADFILSREKSLDIVFCNGANLSLQAHFMLGLRRVYLAQRRLQ